MIGFLVNVVTLGAGCAVGIHDWSDWDWVRLSRWLQERECAQCGKVERRAVRS